MEKLIATLFLAREVSHRLHLMTSSYSQHMALNEFYDEILDLTDSLAEVYQGSYGQFTEIPYLTWDKTYTEAKSLEYLKMLFAKTRSQGIKAEDTELQNIADEVIALFNKTIYKVKFLK